MFQKPLLKGDVGVFKPKNVTIGIDQIKTRTTNVVRNAGCTHSRLHSEIFFNQSMNQ